MLHFIQTLINYISANWSTISILVGGGAGLSVFLQYVLHKFKIDSKKLAYTLINLLSLGAAASAYYVSNTNVLPAYAGLLIAAQTVHRFFVSPYYNKYILPYLQFLSETTAQPTTTYAPPAVATPAAPVVAAQTDPTASFVN